MAATATDEFTRYKRQQARDFLRSVADARLTCRTIRAQIDELADADMKALGYGQTRVKSSRDTCRMQRIVEKREELRAMYADELEIALQKRADAQRALMRLREPFRTLLTLRYLDGMMWRDVASQLGYSEVHARKDLNEAALGMMYDAMRVELPEAI